MTKQTTRRLIPFLVFLAAAGVLSVVIFGPDRTPSIPETEPASEIAPESATEIAPESAPEIAPESAPE
ncbi:hypothetical protein H8D29_00270, partial [PVC group bacterium]|nr:hypothetical protein [PVC group bacterium]